MRAQRASKPPDLEPVGRAWVAALAAANLGAFLAWFGPLQVLLAQQAATIRPEDKEVLRSSAS